MFLNGRSNRQSESQSACQAGTGEAQVLDRQRQSCSCSSQKPLVSGEQAEMGRDNCMKHHLLVSCTLQHHQLINPTVRKSHILQSTPGNNNWAKQYLSDMEKSESHSESAASPPSPTSSSCRTIMPDLSNLPARRTQFQSTNPFISSNPFFDDFQETEQCTSTDTTEQQIVFESSILTEQQPQIDENIRIDPKNPSSSQRAASALCTPKRTPASHHPLHSSLSSQLFGQTPTTFKKEDEELYELDTSLLQGMEQSASPLLPERVSHLGHSHGQRSGSGPITVGHGYGSFSSGSVASSDALGRKDTLSSSIRSPPDHGVTLIPLNGDNIDTHILNMLHQGTTLLRIDEDPSGGGSSGQSTDKPGTPNAPQHRSAVVFARLERTNSILLWCKPYWTSSASGLADKEREKAAKEKASKSKSNNSNHAFHFRFSFRRKHRKEDNSLQDQEGASSASTSGQSSKFVSPLTTKFETGEISQPGLEEGFLDLLHLKDVTAGDSPLDLVAIAKRHRLPESDLERKNCFKLLYGSCLNDNRSVTFLALRSSSVIWLNGLQSILKVVERQRGLADQRLVWLKERYLQLYYENGRCIGPTPAEAIKLFGGRKWTLDAMSRQVHSSSLDIAFKRASCFGTAIAKSTSKLRKKKSTTVLAALRDAMRHQIGSHSSTGSGASGSIETSDGSSSTGHYSPPREDTSSPLKTLIASPKNSNKNKLHSKKSGIGEAIGEIGLSMTAAFQIHPQGRTHPKLKSTESSGDSSLSRGSSASSVCDQPITPSNQPHVATPERPRRMITAGNSNVIEEERYVIEPEFVSSTSSLPHQHSQPTPAAHEPEHDRMGRKGSEMSTGSGPAALGFTASIMTPKKSPLACRKNSGKPSIDIAMMDDLAYERFMSALDDTIAGTAARRGRLDSSANTNPLQAAAAARTSALLQYKILTHSTQLSFVQFMQLFRAFLIRSRRDTKELYDQMAVTSFSDDFEQDYESVHMKGLDEPGQDFSQVEHRRSGSVPTTSPDIQRLRALTFKHRQYSEGQGSLPGQGSLERVSPITAQEQVSLSDDNICQQDQSFDFKDESTEYANHRLEPNMPERSDSVASTISQNSKLIGLLTRNSLVDYRTTLEALRIFDAIAAASIVTNCADVAQPGRGNILRAADFQSFLRVHQGEIEADQSMTEALIARHEPNAEMRRRKCLSFEGFTRYLMDKDNYAYLPEVIKVDDSEMDYPLSCYYIGSSHNTYLTGHQLKGESSVELYSQVLLTGCRCVELDCWDGEDGSPVIYHGHTLTSKISFRKVLETINEKAFVTSPYPVILSLENHCSMPQQNKMATLFLTILGDKLITKFMFESDFQAEPKLPSPNQLKYKVIIKNKKLRSTIGPTPTSIPSTSFPASVKRSSAAQSAIRSGSSASGGFKPIRTNSLTSTGSGGSVSEEEEDDFDDEYDDDEDMLEQIPTSGIASGGQTPKMNHTNIKSAAYRSESNSSGEAAQQHKPSADSAPPAAVISGFMSLKPTTESKDHSLASAVLQATTGHTPQAVPPKTAVSRKSSSQIAPELSDLINYCQAIKFRGFNQPVVATSSKDTAGTSSGPTLTSQQSLAATPVKKVSSRRNLAVLAQQSTLGTGSISPGSSTSLAGSMFASQGVDSGRTSGMGEGSEHRSSTPQAASGSASTGSVRRGILQQSGSAFEQSMSMSMRPNESGILKVPNPSAACYQVSSINENAAKKLCRKSPITMMAYCENQLMRTYPARIRIDSSNFNPVIFWSFGMQMVALNYQTDDTALHINAALFEQNGRAGYILKPRAMWDKNDPLYGRFNPWEKEFDGLHTISLTVTIISGQYVCPNVNNASPQVNVEVIGIPVDNIRQRTKVVQRNSLNPIWGDTFVFKIKFADLAFLRFSVTDIGSNHVTAQRVVPLKCLRHGYRHLRLKSAQNENLPLATIFIYSAWEEEGIEYPGPSGTGPTSATGSGGGKDHCPSRDV